MLSNHFFFFFNFFAMFNNKVLTSLLSNQHQIPLWDVTNAQYVHMLINFNNI